MPAKNLIKRDADPMEQIRNRFLQAMHSIQQQHPEFRSVKAFAAGIEAPYVSINRIDNYRDNPTAYPTTENIYYLRKNFNISAEWVIFGTGKANDPDILDQVTKEVAEVKQQVKRIERAILKKEKRSKK